MAVTKIIPIRATIEKSVAYICNPSKTDHCLYIHSEHCIPQTAALTFRHHLNQARAGGNTIGRHLIQSFAPGEVTPENAHEIGKQLADEILGHQYAFVLATHVDRGHIHNHFVWGAANVATHKKYRSNKNTYHNIRNACDRLCEENGLSVIVPHGAGKSYAEYHADRENQSWKTKLAQTIDAALCESTDLEDLLKRMEAQGYEIKRGKHISFRASGQERFTRAKSLGDAYTEDALKSRIASRVTQNSLSSARRVVHSKAPDTLEKLVDIEAKKAQGKGTGYVQWAKIHNLKLSADTLTALEEYGGYEAFEQKYAQVLHEKMESGSALNAIDKRVKLLQSKLPAVATPAPSTKVTYAEIARLRASRAESYAEYKQLCVEHKKLETIHKNIHTILGKDKRRQQIRETAPIL